MLGLAAIGPRDPHMRFVVLDLRRRHRRSPGFEPTLTGAGVEPGLALVVLAEPTPPDTGRLAARQHQEAPIGTGRGRNDDD